MLVFLFQLPGKYFGQYSLTTCGSHRQCCSSGLNGYNLARGAAGNNEKSAQAAELVGPEAVMISDESTAID